MDGRDVGLRSLAPAVLAWVPQCCTCLQCGAQATGQPDRPGPGLPIYFVGTDRAAPELPALAQQAGPAYRHQVVNDTTNALALAYGPMRVTAILAHRDYTVDVVRQLPSASALQQFTDGLHALAASNEGSPASVPPGHRHHTLPRPPGYRALTLPRRSAARRSGVGQYLARPGSESALDLAGDRRDRPPGSLGAASPAVPVPGAVDRGPVGRGPAGRGNRYAVRRSGSRHGIRGEQPVSPSRWAVAPIGRLAIAVAIVGLAVGVAACDAGNNAPTLEYHPHSDGLDTVVHGIEIKDAFVLGPPIGSSLAVGKSAGLFMALFNRGSPDRLVTASAPATATSVKLPPGGIKPAEPAGRST